MNKKAFIMSWYVDFYAYILFILLLIIFYFFFIKGANEPLTFSISQHKDILDRKLTELFVLKQTYLGYTIQELIQLEDQEKLSTIFPHFQTLLPKHKTACEYSIEYKPKEAVRPLGKDPFARTCYQYYKTFGITLPTLKQQDVVYTVQCPGESCL